MSQHGYCENDSFRVYQPWETLRQMTTATKPPTQTGNSVSVTFQQDTADHTTKFTFIKLLEQLASSPGSPAYREVVLVSYLCVDRSSGTLQNLKK